MAVKSGNSLSLTKRQLQAAQLIAEGNLTNAEIAQQVGVCERTIRLWRQRPSMEAEVERITAELRQAIVTAGVTDKTQRIDILKARWQKLQQVIYERSLDREMSNVPGGSTGLLLKQTKLVKIYSVVDDDCEFGENIRPTRRTTLVQNFTVDVALLRALGDLEKQIASETGQLQAAEDEQTTKPLIMVMSKEAYESL